MTKHQRLLQQARAFPGTCCTAAMRGNAADMRDLAGTLDKIRDSMITSYQAKTNLDRETLVALLDAESWLNATEAKQLGFADEIIPVVNVTARFDLSRFRQPAARSGWDAAFDEVHARLNAARHA